MGHIDAITGLHLFLATMNAIQIAILLYLVGKITCKVCDTNTPRGRR